MRGFGVCQEGDSGRGGSLAWSLQGEKLKSGLESTGREIEVQPEVYMARNGSLVSSLHSKKLKSSLESTRRGIEVWS